MCKYEDCGLPVSARGWCTKHYTRWRRYSDPSINHLPGRDEDPGCSVDGCTGKHQGKGYCNKHYQRWFKFGDPNALYLHEQQRLDAQTRTEKVCPGCKTTKPLGEYHANKNAPDGAAYRCRTCRAEEFLESYKLANPGWKPPRTPEEQAENTRRIKREYKKRHPDVVIRHDVKRRLALEENYIEDVSPIVLAERDCWVCQLCFERIDPSLVYINQITGRPNEGYRTIDHIIPVSKKGDHSYENTRIAHWICNVRRNNRMTENLDPSGVK